MKTKSQTKIITLMKWKQDELKKLALLVGEKLPAKYFTTEDIKEIRSLSNKEADNLWITLIYNLEEVVYQGIDYIFLSNLCPYCIINRFIIQPTELSCRYCSYGKRHGGCIDTKNVPDYRKITNFYRKHDRAKLITPLKLHEYLQQKYPKDFE